MRLAESELEAGMRRADRRYFFVVGLACAVGYTYRLWLLPPVVLAVLEGATTIAARLNRAAAAPARLAVRVAGEAAVTQSVDRAA
jgi:hypothetical protein